MRNPFAKFDSPSEKTTKMGDSPELREQVIEALRTVYDPEIPLNLYDLGLIYAIDIDEMNDVTITMTLTTPHCPVAESMPGKVAAVVRAIDVVNEVKVELVWDPPWTQERLSDEARLALGLF